jgi:hypothetical protein
MKTKCNNCGNEFHATKQWQKYCSNSCRVSAHNKRTQAIITQHNNAMETKQNNDTLTPIETQQTSKQIDAMIERILSERQAVYETKIAAMQKEYENKILELRLNELERKVKDLEKAHEENSGGIKMQDVMAGVGTYFATQMSNQATKQETK